MAHTILIKDIVKVANGSVMSASDFSAIPGRWTKREVNGPSIIAEFDAEVPTLPVNQKAVFQFAVQFRGLQPTIANSATVSSAVPDPDPQNNSARVPPL